MSADLAKLVVTGQQSQPQTHKGREVAGDESGFARLLLRGKSRQVPAHSPLADHSTANPSNMETTRDPVFPARQEAVAESGIQERSLSTIRPVLVAAPPSLIPPRRDSNDDLDTEIVNWEPGSLPLLASATTDSLPLEAPVPVALVANSGRLENQMQPTRNVRTDIGATTPVGLNAPPASSVSPPVSDIPLTTSVAPLSARLPAAAALAKTVEPLPLSPAPAVANSVEPGAVRPVGESLQIEPVASTRQATPAMVVAAAVQQARVPDSIRIALYPAELGEVQLHIQRVDDGIRVRMIAETDQGYSALLAERDRIEDLLRDHPEQSSEGRESLQQPLRRDGSGESGNAEPDQPALGGPLADSTNSDPGSGAAGNRQVVVTV